MSTIQCPKCTAWMDEDGQCPFCGYTISEEEKRRKQRRESILSNIHKKIVDCPEPIRRIVEKSSVEKGLGEVLECLEDALNQQDKKTNDRPSSDNHSELWDSHSQLFDNHAQGSSLKNRLPPLIQVLLKRKTLIFLACIPFLISLFAIALEGFHHYTQNRKYKGLNIPAECKGSFDYLENNACWWDSDEWNAQVGQPIDQFEVAYYNSFYQSCTPLFRCPRIEDETDMILPKWQTTTAKDIGIKLRNGIQPNCMVKAASRHRKSGHHYEESTVAEDVKLYVLNIGRDYRHEVWLSANQIETQSGAAETGTFAEGSYVVAGVDHAYWFKKRINHSNLTRVLLGEEPFYQELIGGKKLYVVFAVPNTRDKDNKDAMIISYRVFGLDNMREVCKGESQSP